MTFLEVAIGELQYMIHYGSSFACKGSLGGADVICEWSPTESTGILSHSGAKLTDWAVREAGAGCYF